MWHRYRHQLATIYQDSHSHPRSIHCSPAELKKQGIKVLVLDFDGVLAADGELLPNAEIQPWLQECIQHFGATQIFILSNRPLPTRIAYFNTHYQGIRWIKEVRKKPYPDGLQQIITLTKQLPQTIMLLDDRLLTGALAACLTQVKVTLVTHPYANWWKRPLRETFFTLLRFSERRLVQLGDWF
jgi:hypothetical protein